jgi:hypothetical protein
MQMAQQTILFGHSLADSGCSKLDGLHQSYKALPLFRETSSNFFIAVALPHIRLQLVGIKRDLSANMHITALLAAQSAPSVLKCQLWYKN